MIFFTLLFKNSCNSCIAAKFSHLVITNLYGLQWNSIGVHHLFSVPQKKKLVMQAWNYMRVSKWWHNLNFWVNYPFKMPFPCCFLAVILSRFLSFSLSRFCAGEWEGYITTVTSVSWECLLQIQIFLMDETWVWTSPNCRYTWHYCSYTKCFVQYWSKSKTDIHLWIWHYENYKNPNMHSFPVQLPMISNSCLENDPNKINLSVSQ